MGLVNYSHSIIIEVKDHFKDGSVPKLFEDILFNDGEGSLSYGISKELGYLLYSENQFNKVFSEDYGLVKYSDLFSSDTISSLGTLEDAKPWFESSELTLIQTTENEFEFYNPEILLNALNDIIKYLDKFKWHTERPKLMERLEELKLLKIIVAFCKEEGYRISSIMA